MLRKLRHQRFIAWLGVLAIWLTIVAPVISRTLSSAPSMPDMAAWCTGHGSGTHPSPTPSAPAPQMNHCGYCTLLGHSPLLSGHTIVFSTAALPATAVPRPWISSSTFFEPVLGAHPRGPPMLSHG